MSDTSVPITTKKDWTSDQEVRWCPACGDYSLVTAVQMVMHCFGVSPVTVRKVRSRCVGLSPACSLS